MSKSFADLGISPAVAGSLAQRGITEPFAVQSLVVPDVLAGHDVLAQSPTGSGKTIAFTAPLIDRIDSGDRRPAALVLAPTRELAQQILDDAKPLAKSRGLKALAVYGGVGIHPQIRDARKAHFLVATPGRLLDLLERNALTLDNVAAVVLDEADRMLDMGFRPDVERILKQTPSSRQTLLFSATLEGEVGALARKYTHEARRHSNAPANGDRPDIQHRFRAVAHEHKVDALASELGDVEDGLTLVFVRTRRGADRLVKRLDRKGVRASAIHGGKSQGKRTRTLGDFERGKINALIATDVAARGIDVRGITHVINFDPPEDRDGYTHRIGRTARAGRSGHGVTFVMPDQEREVGTIAKLLDLDGEYREAGLNAGSRHRPHEPARSHNRGGSGNRGGGSGNSHNRNRNRRSRQRSR